MSGNIDMAKNRLLNLPEPTDDQEPATKGYTDTLSKVVWKDASQTALNDDNRTSSITWTLLDLIARTSPNAKFAIVRMDLQARVVGIGADSDLKIRKHGTSPAYYPRLILDKAGTTPYVFKYMMAIIGLGQGQKIDYAIDVGTNWTIDSDIKVLGYIE